MRRVSVALVVLAALVAACTSSPSGEPDDLARLVPLSGSVTILRGGEEIAATEELTLVAGDLVSTGDRGAARLVLPDDQSLELGPATRAEMLPGPAPRLLQGRLLGVAHEGLDILVGDERLSARNGVFRVQRVFSTIVGVYEGSVFVDPVDQRVPPLRQLTIASGSMLPRGMQPLQVAPNDPWHERFLGRAIDVGLGIERLRRGLVAQLSGPRGPDVAVDILDDVYGRSLLSDLVRALDRSELADLVIAAKLAERAAVLTTGSPRSLLERILDLRGQGAQWIVIVAEWRLFGVLATLTGLIARAVSPPAAGGANLPPGPGEPAVGGPGPGGSPPGGTGPGGDGNGNGGDDDGGGDDPSPPPPPPPECENAVECVVEDLLETANGL